MRITDLVQQAGEASIKKGFRDKPVETGTRLMLIVSEASEALEADRKNHRANVKAFKHDIDNPDYDTLSDEEYNKVWAKHFEHHVKNSFEDELADIVIRVADLCQFHSIDLTEHISLKMEYNRSRPPKHGKEY